ncbi:MAG: hypothetical protein J2O38_07435, partial [Acidimicrobiales bacterium]|nr:hypothetical protein [Acidimicrobiales bacterium]
TGVQFHEVDDEDGTFDPDHINWAVEAAGHHHVTPSLVCVEHPHMAAGGVPWPAACLEAVSRAAGAVSLPVHLDGARLFNAEVATGVPAARSASCATTVMACLTKGLCGPVGSVLAGPAGVIEQAREERFVLGGGMRQAGVLAAAGLVALTSMVERLAEDHRRAGRLAEAVAHRFADGGCEPGRVPTNIVVFHHPEPGRLLEHLRAHGVLAGTIAPGVVRLVTHHDVDDEGIERACRALAGAP